MHPLRLPFLAAASLLLVPALRAQTPPATPRDTTSAVVPPSMMPPAGKCRIWIAGVPAKQQPAPTDCATALRQNPSNGTVVYGPPAKDENEPRVSRTPATRGTTPPKAELQKKPAESAKKPTEPEKKQKKKPERP